MPKVRSFPSPALTRFGVRSLISVTEADLHLADPYLYYHKVYIV